ncbi:hypothetical protein ACFWBF_24975 [Streptomyces sp. NPDC060028]|uniref:hypothetical protein n=1 Tax=Streptomyces sp. NPDC060028 TaxID=3347041 RepID=UPI0036A52363
MDLPRAAPGVGKTYAMPDEGQRLAAAGAEVVVGFVEPHGRRHAAGKAQLVDVRLSPLIAAKGWAAGQVWPPAGSAPVGSVRPARACQGDALKGRERRTTGVGNDRGGPDQRHRRDGAPHPAALRIRQEPQPFAIRPRGDAMALRLRLPGFSSGLIADRAAAVLTGRGSDGRVIPWGRLGCAGLRAV